GIGQDPSDEALHGIFALGGRPFAATRKLDALAIGAFTPRAARKLNLAAQVREAIASGPTLQEVERIDAEQQHQRAEDEQGRETEAATPAAHRNGDSDLPAASGKRKTADGSTSTVFDVLTLAIAFVVAHCALRTAPPRQAN